MSRKKKGAQVRENRWRHSHLQNKAMGGLGASSRPQARGQTYLDGHLVPATPFLGSSHPKGNRVRLKERQVEGDDGAPKGPGLPS